MDLSDELALDQKLCASLLALRDPAEHMAAVLPSVIKAFESYAEYDALPPEVSATVMRDYAKGLRMLLELTESTLWMAARAAETKGQIDQVCTLPPGVPRH